MFFNKSFVFCMCILFFVLCVNTVSASDSEDVDLSKGLVAYYPFNGNANDESGNGNHGVVYGATLTLDRFDNENVAYLFDGNEDSIQLPHNIINQKNDVSCSVWIKTNKLHVAILSGANSTKDNSYLIYIRESISLYIKSGYTSDVSKIVDDSKWHHIICIREGSSGNVKIYIDGIQYINENLEKNELLIEKNGLIIGRDQDCVGGCFEASQDFEGAIDDIRIYNRCLNELEIKALYESQSDNLLVTPSFKKIPSTNGTTAFAVNSNLSWIATSKDLWLKIENSEDTIIVNYEENIREARTGKITIIAEGATNSPQIVEVRQNSIFTDLEDGLVAYYPFNGNSKDMSGNGNHGIEYGGLTYANGILNKAGNFDGVDDFIEVTPISDVSAIENFTISVWTYLLNWKEQPNNYLYDRQFVFDGFTHSKTAMNDFYRQGFSVVYDGLLNSEEIRDSILYKYNENIYLAQNTKINIKGKWHHHVFMRIRDADYTYFDGQLINSTYYKDIKRDDPLNMKHDWFIGTFSGNNPNYGAIKDGYNYSFFGLLDEMRIYNRALSESEIKVLNEIKQNHLSVTPVCKNLLAVSGTTIFTVTSNITWSATTSASWITIQTSPNTISVDYSANLGETRTAKITVSAESTSLSPQYIEITQSQRANNPPVASNQEVKTNTNIPINISLSATDTDNDPLIFSILQPPSHGTISNEPPNIIYTPDQNYHGTDEFTFKANDGKEDSNIAQVTIQINPIITTRHFKEVDGNPADETWTIYLSSATLDGENLQPNDEIAIFDN